MLTHRHERKKRHCQGLGAEASDELICRKSLDFNTWTAWSLKAKLWSALLYIPSSFSILLRFPLLPPGHFSLLYLLTFVGVQWAAGWGTRTGGWNKKGARAEGESSFSWKRKCSRGSAPPDGGTPGQETTWHNMRGTIAGQLRVHTNTRIYSGGKLCRLETLGLRQFHLSPRDYVMWAVFWWFFFSPGADGVFLNNMCAELHFPPVAIQSELWRTEACWCRELAPHIPYETYRGDFSLQG